jgi:hypothetical protein
MGFLSIDMETAGLNFQKVLRDWGVIANTPIGHILSHLYWCIGLCFRTQSTLRIIYQQAYNGCVMLGGGYKLLIGDRLITPRPPGTLRADFIKASPHTMALTEIIATLPFASGNDRDLTMASIVSMQNLKHTLEARPLTEDQRDVILAKARLLRFTQDPQPSLPNATNISNALLLIASTEGITGLHLPSRSLFVTDRTELIWSQFGPLAPSLRVPGGKSQDISSVLRHKQREDQLNASSKLVTIPTRRLGVIMKPLAEAVRDLKETLKDKTIHNPFASAIMSRVSSKSVIKTFEGNSFDTIISSLRKAGQVLDPLTTAGSSKRIRDEDDDDEDNDRAKRMQGFGF